MRRGSFLRAFATVPADAADGQIDALVRDHFRIGPDQAPDIIRAFVRHALAVRQADLAWDALVEVERDLRRHRLAPASPRLATARAGDISLAALLC